MLENQVKEKDKDRQELESLIGSYLASGGRIRQCEIGETGLKFVPANEYRKYPKGKTHE